MYLLYGTSDFSLTFLLNGSLCAFNRHVVLIIHSYLFNCHPATGWQLLSPGTATEGVTPIFSRKKLTTSLLITVCQFCGVTPIYFVLKNRRPFLLITVTFIDFTRVSPRWRVSPRTFFTCPTSFVHYFFVNLPTFFFLRVSPHGGSSLRASAAYASWWWWWCTSVYLKIHKCHFYMGWQN